MIDRYSSPEMRRIWSLEDKFRIWKEIEVSACEYWHRTGRIPDQDWEEIRTRAAFDTKRVEELEATLHHDVIAFLTDMADKIGPASRHVHFGLTSSDIVDTALSVSIVESGRLILAALDRLSHTLYTKSLEYKDLITVGRTHGVHAEPTTLGLKLLGYYTECQRNRERLERAVANCAFGKISGAVGTYSQVPPELEVFVLEQMGLSPEPVSTQVVPRDRHAEFLNALNLTMAGIARLAQEVRLLQKSESREVEEPFQKGQKGSSAMPHKRNPILCERICGLARVVAGYAGTAVANIGLWHERDISHSSAERMILPDATSLTEYALGKMEFVIRNLHVYPENCESVLNHTRGLLYSSRALLVVTSELAVSREEAYALVQEAAMKVWADNSGKMTLRQLLESHPQLSGIPASKWSDVFNPRDFLLNLDRIFSRVKAPQIPAR